MQIDLLQSLFVHFNFRQAFFNIQVHCYVSVPEIGSFQIEDPVQCTGYGDPFLFG